MSGPLLHLLACSCAHLLYFSPKGRKIGATGVDINPRPSSSATKEIGRCASGAKSKPLGCLGLAFSTNSTLKSAATLPDPAEFVLTFRWGRRGIDDAA